MAIGRIDDEQFQAWADRVRGKIDRDEVKKELSRSVKRIGTQAIRTVKSNTPVDTGHLRRSWRVQDAGFQGSGWVIEIKNGIEYASYVENGHRQTPGRYVPAIGKRLKASWIPGQFFMKRSLNEVEAQLPELITPGLWAFRDLLS